MALVHHISLADVGSSWTKLPLAPLGYALARCHTYRRHTLRARWVFPHRPRRRRKSARPKEPPAPWNLVEAGHQSATDYLSPKFCGYCNWNWGSSWFHQKLVLLEPGADQFRHGCVDVFGTLSTPNWWIWHAIFFSSPANISEIWRNLDITGPLQFPRTCRSCLHFKRVDWKRTLEKPLGILRPARSSRGLAPILVEFGSGWLFLPVFDKMLFAKDERWMSDVGWKAGVFARKDQDVLRWFGQDQTNSRSFQPQAKAQAPGPKLRWAKAGKLYQCNPRLHFSGRWRAVNRHPGVIPLYWKPVALPGLKMARSTTTMRQPLKGNFLVDNSQFWLSSQSWS